MYLDFREQVVRMWIGWKRFDFDAFRLAMGEKIDLTGARSVGEGRWFRTHGAGISLYEEKKKPSTHRCLDRWVLGFEGRGEDGYRSFKASAMTG